MSSSASIVQDYEASIRELTFNSRPIIDNLTTIARENTEIADQILDVITSRITRAIPDQKLFSLYLLDSICKNVGNPYNILIGDDIFRVFSGAYVLVNDQVRGKLVNLFETWKLTKTKASSLPLFPSEELQKIEAFLAQAGYKRKERDSTPTPGLKLTNASLIAEINSLLPLFETKLAGNTDKNVKERFNALNQLKALLSAQSMKPNELQAVQAKLLTIKKQEAITLNSPIPTPAITPATTPGMPQALLNSISNSNDTLSTKPKAEDLFEALLASGLVLVDQSLKPGSKPTYELQIPRIKYQAPAQVSKNGMPSNQALEQLLSSAANKTEYERLKANELVKMATSITKAKSIQAFINNNQVETSSVQLLYDCKPSKCGICGNRFTSDEAGTRKKAMHLDWHFRINKKLAQNKTAVQSRNWYLDDYEWVKFHDADLLEYSTPTGVHALQTTNGNVRTNEIPYVVIPSTETNMNNMCLICREQIKATYSDDLGEWCWYNCVAQKGDKTNRKIFHATCFNEANRKRGAEDNGSARVKRERLAA